MPSANDGLGDDAAPQRQRVAREPPRPARCTSVVRRPVAVMLLSIAMVAGCVPSPTVPASAGERPGLDAGSDRERHGTCDAAPSIPARRRSRRATRSSSPTSTAGSCSTTEDVYTMDVDGSNVVRVAGDPAGSSSTAHGRPTATGSSTATRPGASTRTTRSTWCVPMDRSGGTSPTTRPTSADPTGRRTARRSCSTGPRRRALRGYLMDPDGSTLRPISIDSWVEYASFSPDGRRIAFEGAEGSNYELFVADLASGAVTKLTSSPGHDRWPALVTRRLDDRLHERPRRLRACPSGPGVLAGRVARGHAPRHLDRGPTVRTCAGSPGSTASSWPGPRTVPTCHLRVRALCRPTGGDGPPGAPRRWGSCAPSVASGLALTPGAGPVGLPVLGSRAAALPETVRATSASAAWFSTTASSARCSPAILNASSAASAVRLAASSARTDASRLRRCLRRLARRRSRPRCGDPGQRRHRCGILRGALAALGGAPARKQVSHGTRLEAILFGVGRRACSSIRRCMPRYLADGAARPDLELLDRPGVPVRGRRTRRTSAVAIVELDDLTGTSTPRPTSPAARRSRPATKSATLDRAWHHLALARKVADHDRAARAPRRQLHDVHVLGLRVVVQVEPHLVPVELDRPVDVADRQDHHFEVQSMTHASGADGASDDASRTGGMIRACR